MHLCVCANAFGLFEYHSALPLKRGLTPSQESSTKKEILKTHTYKILPKPFKLLQNHKKLCALLEIFLKQTCLLCQASIKMIKLNLSFLNLPWDYLHMTSLIYWLFLTLSLWLVSYLVGSLYIPLLWQLRANCYRHCPCKSRITKF